MVFFVSPNDTSISNQKWYGIRFRQLNSLYTQFQDDYLDFIRLRGDTIDYFRRGSLRYLRNELSTKLLDEKKYQISILFIFPRKYRTTTWESSNTLFSWKTLRSTYLAKRYANEDSTFLITMEKPRRVLGDMPMGGIDSVIVSPKLGILGYKYQTMGDYEVYDCRIITSLRQP
jgi:hypothetical protein